MSESQRALDVFNAPPVLDLRAELRELANQLNSDEVAVIVSIARRMVTIGVASYGHLDIATDKRDMQREAHEEHLDACVYLAVDGIRKMRAR